MGDNQPATQQVIQQSAPTNPQITATQNNLLSKLDTATNAGVPVFNQSLYGGVGNTTKQSWQDALNASANPDYTNGVNGAISSFGDTAAGKNIGTADPGYQTVRNKLSNDVLTSTNAAFNNSGLFGSDNNQYSAASGLADSLGGLDLQQYNNGLDRQAAAVPLLQQLYAAAQQPAATRGAIGSAQDADAQAALLGQNDLYQRQNGSLFDTLARSSSILNGTTANAGNTTTTTSPAAQQTPWWQSLASLGGALL